MAVEVVTRREAARIAVVSLNLDPTVLDLGSSEALSEVLRRVACFHCPTTNRHLVDVAFDAIKDLVDDTSLKDRLRDLLEEIINIGDLLELPTSEGQGRLLYLDQPSFVARGDSRLLLLGVRPEGAPLVPDEMEDDIEREGHARFLQLADHPEALSYLRDQGLRELSRDAWLRSPRPVAAQEFVTQFDVRLDAVASGAIDVGGTTLLDTAARVTYYKGRWRAPSATDSGRFVGRRSQAYGLDIWIYAELEDGVFTRAIDLPVSQELARGCDEAWRLQAALDRCAGKPQVVRVEDDQNHRSVVSVFSPLPSWAQRRLDMVGTPVPSRGGVLMCYAIGSEEVELEVEALKTLLWMTEVD